MPAQPQKNSPEYADRVNLIKKIKVKDAWRFAPAVVESNGKLKDRVRVNGAIEVHPEGTYYIEWREQGRRFRAAVDKDDAIDQARRKAVELRAIREGLIAAPEPPPVAPTKRRSAKPSTTTCDSSILIASPGPISRIASRSTPCCAARTRNNMSKTRRATTFSIS